MKGRLFMKKIKLTSMGTICNLCMAMALWVRFSKISLLFFGEQKYPLPEDFE